jgi:hypothetical protein
MRTRLRSCVCSQEQLESPAFRKWCARIRQDPLLHRKQWEWCYIAQALYERGMLRPGRRGLGFGVGRELLVSLFAGFGCAIVATDMDQGEARKVGWTDTNQHAAGVDVLNETGLCPPEQFRRLVSQRTVDMNAIPSDLRGFDFTWSACSFEHIGSIALGKEFVCRQMDCLRPGGVAVHTTEFNVSSNADTLDNTVTVLFRRRDLQDMARRLRANGHRIDLDLTLGTGVADNYVDEPPYRSDFHLRLKIAQYVTTSIGLIVEKPSRSAAAVGRCLRWLRRTAG